MELDIGVHVTRLAGSITFTSTESDAVFLILAHLPGFAKDDVAVSLNESGTEININGEKGKSYLIETEVSQRVRISHEVSAQGFSEDFLIPDGVDLDRIDVGFEEEEAILVITIPKVERQEQEIALGVSKDIPLYPQETGICEKELEADYEDLEQELVEREIETIEEITEADEIEIIPDLEILEIDKKEPNPKLETKHEDPRPESEINLDNPETVSDIKLEDLELQPEIKLEDPKLDFEIITENPEMELEFNQEDSEPDVEINQEDPDTDVEINQSSPELGIEMNEESKSEENLEEMDSESTEKENNHPEVEIRQNPDELKPEITENPQEIKTETKGKEKEDEIAEVAKPEYPTPGPNPELPKTIEKCEPDHAEQQDRVGPSVKSPPSECDPDSKAEEKEDKIAEDAHPKYPTPGLNPDLPKPIEKCEPDQNEQQDPAGPSITSPPSECDPDSAKLIEKSEPNHSEKHVQEDPTGPSVTSPPSECDPDSAKLIEKSEPDHSEKHVQEDNHPEVEIRQNPDELKSEITENPQEIKTETKGKEKEDEMAEVAKPEYPTPGPNPELPKPIEKCEPDHAEQQDRVGPSVKSPPSECDPDSKAEEKEDKIAEDTHPEYPTPGLNQDLPKPMEKCEPDQNQQQDPAGPSITSPPSECDPDSEKLIEKSESDQSEKHVQEDPFIPSPQPNPEPNSIQPIDKNKPDQNEQGDHPAVHPMSDPGPDSPKSIQRSEISSEEKQIGSDQESEVQSKETEEEAEVNGKEWRRRARRGSKSTFYPSVIVGSVFILSLMALAMHVLKNKRHTSTRR